MSEMRRQFLYTQDTNTLVNNIIVLESINAERNDEITALRARAERAEAALPRWIPVSERLPEKETTDLGEEYLVMLDYPYSRVAPMNFVDDEWFSGGWGAMRTRWNDHVTHWMPLPEPPALDAGKDAK